MIGDTLWQIIHKCRKFRASGTSLHNGMVTGETNYVPVLRNCQNDSAGVELPGRDFGTAEQGLRDFTEKNSGRHQTPPGDLEDFISVASLASSLSIRFCNQAESMALARAGIRR